ncbi:hypothetical protein BDZ89DRAFT_1065953 [Hymenopellis radicata]|nr:hypothetical protein BDZ89DRAFT_1065953 [Hymenopellis radicata]
MHQPFTSLPPSIHDRSSLPCFHSSTEERSLRILLWLAVWCMGGVADALLSSPDDFPHLPEDDAGLNETPSLVASQVFSSTSEPFIVNITHFPPHCEESKKRNLQGFWTVTEDDDDNPTAPTSPVFALFTVLPGGGSDFRVSAKIVVYGLCLSLLEEAPVYHHINADTGSLPEISMLTHNHDTQTESARTLAQWVPGPQMRARIAAILPIVSERLRLVPKKKLKGLKAWSCAVEKDAATGKTYPAPTWIEC